MTAKLGHVAGRAFAEAVHGTTDQSYLNVFQPQMLVAESAQVAADESATKRHRPDGWPNLKV